MIYAILIYLVLGIGTSIITSDVSILVHIGIALAWPLYWFAFVFAHFVGWMPAKCAWCGKSVAGHAQKDKWRAHYLDECNMHPLAFRIKELYALIDELDSKNTANRVRAEKAEKAEKVLTWYANRVNYFHGMPGEERDLLDTRPTVKYWRADNGERARAALEVKP